MTDDPTAAALRRELSAQTVPYDDDRAERMIRVALGAAPSGRPVWVAPLAAAAVVASVGGVGGVLAVTDHGGSTGPAAPVAPIRTVGVPTTRCTPAVVVGSPVRLPSAVGGRATLVVPSPSPGRGARCLTVGRSAGVPGGSTTTIAVKGVTLPSPGRTVTFEPPVPHVVVQQIATSAQETVTIVVRRGDRVVGRGTISPGHALQLPSGTSFDGAHPLRITATCVAARARCSGEFVLTARGGR